MTRTDNTRFLAQATARPAPGDTEGKPATPSRTWRAPGQPVNFSAVAAAAGVSRASLYREPRHPRPDQPHALRARPRPEPSAPPNGPPPNHCAPSWTPHAQRTPACEPRTPRSASKPPVTWASSARNLPRRRRHRPRHAQNLTSATCLARKNPAPPGLLQNGLKITADLRGNPVARMAVRCTPNWVVCIRPRTRPNTSTDAQSC